MTVSINTRPIIIDVRICPAAYAAPPAAASAGIVSAHSSASTANSDQIRFIIRLLNAKMQFLCEIFIKTIYHPCADGKSFYKKHKKQDPRP